MATTSATETASTMAPAYTDLRDWLRLAEELGQLRHIEGADWDLEIGGITDMVCRQAAHPTCVLFDRIKGYPSGYRVLSNPFVNLELGVMTLGLPQGLPRTEIVKAWRQKARAMRLAPTREVSSGPVLENVLQGGDVDLYRFPAPRWREEDGGRYLGTACAIVTRDPDDGQLNVGTYRMQVQDRDKLGLYITPGHHGAIHRDKYFARKEPMPLVAAFGIDPLLFSAGSLSLPITMNEYEWAGAVKGKPFEVIRGPVTGLPLPADAEIAVEGFVYPDRKMNEGPFGEFTGYYASAMREEPYVQVEALYHRNEPIILGSLPMRPPDGNYSLRGIILDALIWDELEGAGVPDVRGVAHIPSAWYGIVVVSIKQRYAGHARQAGMIASQCHTGAYMGRYVVVVDDDVDPNNFNDVMWTLCTRSDPAESADLIRNAWSGPLDPRIPPERRAKRDFTSSRMVIDATRPFHWRDQFPGVGAASPELQARLREKFGEQIK